MRVTSDSTGDSGKDPGLIDYEAGSHCLQVAGDTGLRLRAAKPLCLVMCLETGV